MYAVLEVPDVLGAGCGEFTLKLINRRAMIY